MLTRTLLTATLLTLTGAAAPSLAFQPSKPLTKPPEAGTAKPAKDKLYDESADAKTQIASALARAKHENKRVLIQWGGNWCPWCIRLHQLYKSDKAIAHELLYEYELVLVDAGKPDGKNNDLALTYGADLAKNGYPFLTILDAAGKPLANQPTDPLEAKNDKGESKGLEAGHNPAAVLKFLTDHKAAYLPAQSVLDAGLAQAKASGKRAFVHFGAPWCGWCKKLEAWMARPDVAPLLAKDFVDIKIDQDRTLGGTEMLAKMSDGKSGGIPWFVFLDESGKPLANSTAPSGNIGFPSEPQELAHFESMLKAAAKSLTPQDIAALIESLREKPKKNE